MVAIGDIVAVRQLPDKRWAVIGRVSHLIPPGRRCRLRGVKPYCHACTPGHYAGTGDLRVIEHPQIKVGQVVNYENAVGRYCRGPCRPRRHRAHPLPAIPPAQRTMGSTNRSRPSTCLEKSTRAGMCIGRRRTPPTFAPVHQWS